MRARPEGFVSRRSAVLARQGAVATSQPLSAVAGVRVLMDGGNAADAAVTAAAMLNVVEPMSTGIGGDCFALIYQGDSGQVAALNASGRSPAAFTLSEAQRLGLRRVPLTGPLPVTVPGAVSGWAALLDRFGTMTLAQCLAPAIAAAEEGFAVSERISSVWQNAADKLSEEPETARVYLPAPLPGQIHRQPDLAHSLRTLGEGGPDALYCGPMASKIAQCVQQHGGYLTQEDMAAHQPTWDVPIRTTYHGVDILEHPPNGQGLAALLALNMLEGDNLGEMTYYDPARWHLMIEAMRLAMVDAGRHVADPQATRVPVGALLSRRYAAERRTVIRPDRALAQVGFGQPEDSDTVYLTAVDRRGNAVSFINSLYHGFGSGLVAPGTGICLQNRGACFSLEPNHPNVLAGGKRPYHTIIPALALREGRLWLSFGVIGGFMQPQGHLQVLVNLVDFDLDPQAALDAPRFCVDEQGGPGVLVESPVPSRTRRRLAELGHDVHVEPAFTPRFGGGQIIANDPESGALWCGSDPRKDGCAVGY